MSILFTVNRYIVHSDDHNPYLDSMYEFEKKLQNFKPDLLVVGGLQMMDNFPFKQGELGKYILIGLRHDEGSMLETR